MSPSRRLVNKMAFMDGIVKFYPQLLLLLISPCLLVDGLEEFFGQCGLNIDLMMLRSAHAGLLTMPLPTTMKNYQNPSTPINCDVTVTFTSGMHLLIELYYLDIMPTSGDLRSCSTGLEIFDQTGRKYYGSRLCMEGWQWEARHKEKQQEKQLVQNSPVTFRLISGGPYRGLGFKVHFNQIRPAYPCFIHEHKCRELTRCVHDDLTCDGWDDCGDRSDEREEAGCKLLAASEICSILMGIILLIGSGIEIFIFAVSYRKLAQQYGIKLKAKAPIKTEKNSIEPVLNPGRRYNSQDSLPSKNSKSAVTTWKEQDSNEDSIDKLDLEKGVRHNKKAADNVSERSDHSWKNRSQSPSVKKSESHDKGSHSKLNQDTAEPVSGIDNPALKEDDRSKKDRVRSQERPSSRSRDRGYSRNHSRYSDTDDDYDRDRYKDNRRRSSRERSRERDYRRSSSYSDESENDRVKECRRRRSYDRYSDDSDYEYERERERRRRSRKRSHAKDDNHSDRDGIDNRDKSCYSRSSWDRDRRHRDTYKDKPGRRSPYDDDRSDHPRRTPDRRHSPSLEKDSSSKYGNSRSRSQEDNIAQEKYSESPPLPLPPPYTEEDTLSFEEQNEKLPASTEEVSNMNQQNKTPLVFSEIESHIERPIEKLPLKDGSESNWRRSDDCGEKYGKFRWAAQQKGRQDIPPPEYKETAPKHGGIIYREESV